MRCTKLALAAAVVLTVSGCQSATPPILVDDLTFVKTTARIDRKTPSPSLPATRCIWKDPGDAARLSWDAVATFHLADADLDSRLSTHQIVACTDRSPDDRPVEFDGRSVQTPPWATAGGGAFLTECWDDNNPYNECRLDALYCSRIEPACPETPHLNFPFCQAQCTMRPRLGIMGFAIQTERVQTTGVPRVGRFHPVVSNVPPGGTTLARPLTFQTASSDPEHGIFRFTWIVPEVPLTAPGPDGAPVTAMVWAEHFTPDLVLSKVRVFRPGSRYIGSAVLPARFYLDVSTLRIGALDEECRPNLDEPVEVTVDSCPRLALFTPAAAKQAPETQALWDVEIRSEERLDTAVLYVEFTLVSPRQPGSPALLRTYPGTPAAPIGGSRDLTAFLLDTSGSADTWTVERADFAGGAADAFSNVRTGARSIPFSITGSSVPIAMTFSPSTAGEQQTTLQIALHGQQYGPLLLTANVSALAYVPARLQATPSSLALTVAKPAVAEVQKITVENVGGARLVRGTIAVSGPDASRFRVGADRALRQPPKEQLDLDPGQTETIWVQYRPGPGGSPGGDRAQLRIDTTVGDTTIPLRGMTTP